MQTFCNNLYESHSTRRVEPTKDYETLHVSLVQSEVESDSMPNVIETVSEIVEFPEHICGVGKCFQQTDLHYLIRNGMNLPTDAAYIDTVSKTDILSNAKRTLNGFINSANKIPEVSPEPTTTSEPTV